MTNNFEGWKHIATAPKDREVLVWDGKNRYVAVHNKIGRWLSHTGFIYPTHWRGCPPPPAEALPDDEE
jgi:hypothetical protein